jgi:hypothetical protein
MTTGNVNSASVRDDHRIPPLPYVGLGSDEAKKSSDHVTEEPQAEDAEDDAGHACEVVDGDAHDADERALFRVLAQIEGRQDTEGHDHQRHDQCHHHGAEERRPDAALAVGLAWIGAEELAPAVEVDGDSFAEIELVPWNGPHDLGQRHDVLLTLRHLHDELVVVVDRAQLTDLVVDALRLDL